MNDLPGPKLDLQLAWSRVNADFAGRGFTSHPYDVELVRLDEVRWLEQLSNEVSSNRYQPSSIYIANVPKGKGAVRPGACMALRDRLVYAACIGAIISNVRAAISWPTRTIDFSYPLASQDRAIGWITGEFKAWQRFREASVELVKGKAYGVLADITGYYENIDLATLSSDLRATGADEATVRLLMVCLNRWAQVGGRGIPQGQTASDILGRLYLNSVDVALHRGGYIHCRYVDDFRIFCVDYAEAKRSLVALSELLRHRGLNIQTAKSAIHRADVARNEIDGITPILQEVKKQYLADLTELLGSQVYLSTSEAETLLSARSNETPIEILRETFKAYFADADPSNFDKTLFRFLVRRLGKAKDRFAFEYSKTIFERQPQETHTVLAYFAAVGATADVEPFLIAFIESKDAVYHYQAYQIIEWILEHLTTVSNDVIVAARIRAFDTRFPPYLRSVCLKLLGRHGDMGDLERIEHIYPDARSSLDQAELMCCLQRMERGRRNSFIGRAANDGPWNTLAARWIKLQSEEPLSGLELTLTSEGKDTRK